jgi:AcrR family transcriptional regulator
MDNEELSVQDKIILATIDCIEEEGINAVTTRSIAKKANVNSASINYYFGTKDNLLQKTFESRLSHVKSDLKEIIEHNKDNADLAVKDFLAYTFEGMIRYPGFMKANFYEAFINNNYDGTSVKWINDTLNSLLENMKQNNPEINLEDIKLSMTQMISSILLVGLMPNLFNDFLGMDIRDAESQKKYIDYLFHQHFNHKNVDELKEIAVEKLEF